MQFRALLIASMFGLTPLALITPPAYGDTDPVYTSRFSNTAIGGYDAVAYFTEGEPVEGSSVFATDYKGARFHFASQQNLDTFLADPVKYAPQYGGYCAYAVAKGTTAKGSPKNWAIVEGKLYLNLNDGIQSRWDKDRSGYITSADAEWPGIVSK